MDTPNAVVVVCGRGMGVPIVDRRGPSTGVRGRGRALDTPNAVVIFWTLGCCRGHASDSPDAVVIVCGRGLWYWSICLRSSTSSFGVSGISFLVGIKRTVSCSTAVRATSSCCSRSIAISFQPSFGTWFEPTVTGRDPPKE